MRRACCSLAAGIVFAIGGRAAPETECLEIGLQQYSGNWAPLRNGYCVDGYWTPGLETDASWRREPPKHFTTRALYQVKGLIDETAAIRRIDTSDVDGLVSLMSPSALGWTMYIRPVDTNERWWRVRNTDGVGRAHDYYHVVTLQSGIELSYELAEELDVIEWRNEDGSRYRWVEVCITDSDPDGACPGAPVDYTEWWLETVEYEE